MAVNKRVGRPTDYTKELAAVICGRMSQGESIRKICASEDMPASSTIYLWLINHSEFSEQYALAAEERAHAMAEETIDIADDGSNDWMVREGKDKEPGWAFNGEHVQRSRLRVDTRKWFVSKMAPKKYGDKITQEITGKDGGPVQTEDVNARELVASRIAGIASRNTAPENTD